jgi:hypothetical protein
MERTLLSSALHTGRGLALVAKTTALVRTLHLLALDGQDKGCLSSLSPHVSPKPYRACRAVIYARGGGRVFFPPLRTVKCYRYAGEGRELPCARPPNPLPAWTLDLLSILIGKVYTYRFAANIRGL